MSPNKLLIIGLDGATFDLIDPWVEAGHLPTFARLLRQGARGLLRSVPNTDTAPAWATFATGLDPANHGLFHELGWSDDRRTLRPTTGADRHGPSFWRIASDAGQRVIVINVPSTYPAERVNGVMLAGVDAPGVDAPGFCHPPDFLRQVPAYRIESQIQAAIKEGRPAEGVSDARSVTQARTDTLLRAMDQADWNLAVMVYSMPDVVQHFFWRQMVDEAGPQRHAIREGYTLLDQQIERLLAQAGPETNLILVSDHGFGPLCATPDHLAAWLARQGFIRQFDPSHLPWRRRLLRGGYDWLRNRLSEGQKQALRRWLPGLRNRVESDVRFAGIDWSATQAYVGPSPYEVWINTQGREPQGIVRPGAEYQRVCQALVAALLDWRHPQTGEKRVLAAYPRDQVYQGRFLHLAPDVTIEWNPAAAPPPEELEGNASQFDADHLPQGVLVAAGPDVRAGGEVRGARLVDLAPTALRLLGLSAPEPLDGQVLNDLMAQPANGVGR